MGKESKKQEKTGAYRRALSAMALFFALNIPFRMVMQILPYSEVRPSNAIPPVLGILWGRAGAWGTAVANLLADVLISRAPARVCIPGVFINFLYAYLPYRLWYGAEKKEGSGEQKMPPQMDSVPEIIKYCMIIMADSAVVTPMLSITFMTAGQMMRLSDISFLFFNNFDFAILLGIPMLIFASFLRERKSGRKLSIGTRAVAGFMMLSVLFVAAMGILAYELLKLHTDYDSYLRWNMVYRVMGIGIHVLFAMTLLFLGYVEKYITKPLGVLTESMKKFAAADHLNARIEAEMKETCRHIRTGDELQVLAEAFFKMTQDIGTYVWNLAAVTAEKEKIGAELSVASRIQEDMLPMVFPAFPQRKEFQIYASMHTAKEVGGDFYDFFLIDDDHLGIVMADVSGKGVPAALFMVVAKTLLKNQAKLGEEPWDIFYHVNNQLCENNSSGMFVTAWLGILELDTGKLVYSNAGHTRPMVCLVGRGFERFPDAGHGFVLGGMEKIRFPKGNYVLERGERLFLYTDGVTEANNRNGELFGEERLMEILNFYKEEPLKRLLESIKRNLDEFAGGGEQFDDITMLMLAYEGVE